MNATILSPERTIAIVREFRANETALRQLDTRGGSNGATRSARARRIVVRLNLEAELVSGGRRILAGALRDEFLTRVRLAEVRRTYGAGRPELETRIRRIAADIRNEVAAAQIGESDDVPAAPAVTESDTIRASNLRPGDRVLVDSQTFATITAVHHVDDYTVRADTDHREPIVTDPFTLVDILPRDDASQTPAAWPDAAAAYHTQSTDTCDHGRLLWQSCRACGVGAYAPNDA